MASVAFHQFNQFKEQGHVKLFGDYGGYAAGMHQRDFVYIDDVVAVNLWFFDNPSKSGLFNLGTGRAQPFNDIARTVVNTLREKSGKPMLSLTDMVGEKLIQYIPFPDTLVGKYQCHTQADITALRTTGCDRVFANVQTGVSSYILQLASK
jgi:ADP-L-glycero-D-manno-heptose 6-epimerase